MVALGTTWHLYRSHVDRSNLRRCEQNLRILIEALVKYSIDHGGKYPGGRLGDIPRIKHATLLESSLVPNYLKEMPTCPAAGRDTYTPGYRSDAYDARGILSYDTCVVRCRGRHHVSSGLPPDYPAFVSTLGLLSTVVESTSEAPLPEGLAINGVRLGDTRHFLAKTRLEHEGRFAIVGQWGITDDDTFLPCEQGSWAGQELLYDSNDRVCLILGTELSLQGRILGRQHGPIGTVLSTLGPPNWKVRLHDGYCMRIFERGGVRLTITGDKVFDQAILAPADPNLPAGPFQGGRATPSNKIGPPD